MSKPLTVKEAKLVKAKVRGMTNAKAYVEAGYRATSDAVAEANTRKVLAKPNVQEALQLALEKHNLTPDRIMGVVNDAMDAKKINIVRDPMGGEDSAFAEETPDHSIRLKAAGMAAQFMGIGKNNDSGASIHFHQHVDNKKADYDF